MSTKLNNILKAVENLDIDFFEDQLEFSGTYSGLTAYNFCRYLEKVFIYINNMLIEKAPLVAHKIDAEQLMNQELGYVFCYDDVALLYLVFTMDNDSIVDIKNGDHLANTYSENIELSTMYCVDFQIYEEDKSNYISNSENNLEISTIKKAMNELLEMNEYAGIGFEYCQLWYNRYKYLGNYSMSFGETNKVYRYKEEITFVLNHLQKFINEELHSIDNKIKKQIASYFDLSNNRENAIYQNIAQLTFCDFDNHDFYYLGVSEVKIPTFKLHKSRDFYLDRM